MEKRFALSLLAITAVAALGIATPALAQPSGVPCLRRADIYDVRPFDGNRSLLVTDNARRLYKVTFQSKCFALNTHTAIRFLELQPTRLACLEPGDGIGHVGDFGSLPRCTISKIEYIQPGVEVRPAQVKAAG